jgi:hypothetical protein
MKLLTLPPPKLPKKTRWQVTNQKGDIYTVEGTDIITEEDNTAVHVYDKNTCILVIFDAHEVRALDERVQFQPAKKRRNRRES